MDFVVVIPARYASTRLPGKALVDIAGKPMVVHVVERAKLSGAAEVWVATDDRRIEEAVKKFGHDVMMTSDRHASGTDRLAEVAGLRGWSEDRIVMNVQGDEPRIPPALIREVAQVLNDDPGASMSTAAFALANATRAFDPNLVKVVLDKHGRALYFSRATIPWARDEFARTKDSLPGDLPLLGHIGLYGYRCGFLRTYSTLSQPAIERFEALEQLRALWHGFSIAVTISHHAPESDVNTPEDLEHVRHLFGENARP
ncbi:MAG: 3-deoxy-manno-octulosonate cytidylyltransferase [Betaproteobacteria bacterium]|nr:3-deoxy-manno-octulosonate cytidylyltransferase [Betaproteobacteria bacterium]